MSNVVEKVKAKIDNVLHKDETPSHNVAGTHQAHHNHNHNHNGTTGNYPATTTAAPLSSNTGAGYGSTNAGPHNSNIANKLDPRVDSDRDGSHNLGAASYGPGGATNPNTTTGYGTQSSAVGAGAGYGSTNAGPHNSNMANKLDPRVDSDRDGSQNLGAASYGPGGAVNSNTNTFGTQQAGVGNGYGAGAQTTAGPHSSNLANKLDPRVDSDLDGSRNAGMAKTGPGAAYNASTGPASATAGHHGSNLLNKLDPRVDSDASNNNVHGGIAAHDTAHTHHTHPHHNNNNPTNLY
jgi:hypothetical protein